MRLDERRRIVDSWRNVRTYFPPRRRGLVVVQALVHSPVSDEIVWCAIWLSIAIWSQLARNPVVAAAPAVRRWRIVHGLTAAILSLYVLVGAMLFQIATGLYLAWRWSGSAQGFHRTYQAASGAYLSMFILGHMNSVFIYARSSLGIPTDWNFAIGAPTGLIHDAWNIRLLPHYTLGVFFVLSHIASGLRVVLIAHGVDRRRADHFWGAGVVLSVIVAAAIIAGMCGVRIGASVS